MAKEKKSRKRFRKRTCPWCRKQFRPKPQHAHNQRWCSKPECQAGRKRVARYFWLKRNPGYYVLDDEHRKRKGPPKRPRRHWPELVIVLHVLVMGRSRHKTRVKMQDLKQSKTQRLYLSQPAVLLWVTTKLAAIFQRLVALSRSPCYSSSRKENTGVAKPKTATRKDRQRHSGERSRKRRNRPCRKRKSSPSGTRASSRKRSGSTTGGSAGRAKR